MNITTNILAGVKKAALLAVASIVAVPVFAQSQGYKDGIEYYKAGQYENAKTILTNTLNDATTDKAIANYYLGETELALKDQAAAKKYFQAGQAIDPQDPYNMVGLGSIDLLNGNAEGAKELFKGAQKIAKKNMEVTVAIARAYYNADPVKYAKEIDQYLRKAHKDSKEKEPSIFILEGDMAYDAQDFGGAAAKYENAILNDAQNPAGYVKYANAYFKVNPQFAIQKLEEFLQHSPNSALAQRELAEKYYQADHWVKAADAYGKYIQNPNHFPEDRARYAVLLYYGNKYPESMEIAKDVLNRDPNNFVMQRLLFLNLAKQEGQAQAAADEAAKFFANNPNGNFTTNDYTSYADVLSTLGNDSLAVVQYELASQKDPENLDLLKELSSRYTQAKQYVKSADVYAQYISKLETPSANDYFNAAGRYLNAAATAGIEDLATRKAASEKGLQYIEECIKKAEPNPDILKYKARLYIAGNGNVPTPEAIATYDEMIKLLDTNPEAKNPANQDNELPLYREGYQFNIIYFTKVNPDKDKASEFTQKYKEVNDLINGAAQN